MRNSKIVFILFILLLQMALSIKAQQNQPSNKSEIIETIDGKDFYIHFVKKGETLFTIARAYGITVDDIFKTNPTASEGIYEGKILKIPVKNKTGQAVEKKEKEPEKDFFYHIVKNQETLYSIAKKYGTTVDKIKAFNPELGESIKEGQTLKIPVRKENEDRQKLEWEGKTKTHTIQKGETLYSIAREYNVTTGEIKNANPGLSDALSIGKKILIPNQESGMTGGANVIYPDERGKVAEPVNRRKHTVVKGETLYSIARDNATSVDSLKKYNPWLTPYLSIGQVINLPETQNTSNYIVHKSGKKNSLEDIANLYNVDYAQLVKLNPQITRKTREGQQVKIPVEVHKAVEATKENETEEEEIIQMGCESSENHHFKTYNIALMLPLFLEQLDSINAKEKVDFGTLTKLTSFRFLDFYGGFKMAVDSMQAMGMNINLFVYDVDNDQKKTTKVLNSSELGSMDLIVGPLYRNSFTQIAGFAKEYKIPIINPLSNREEVIYGNPYVFKLIPSEIQQVEILTDYILRAYPDKNIVLVRNNKYKYQNEVSFIRNTLNRERPLRVNISNKKIASIIAGQGNNKSTLLTENKLLERSILEINPNDSTSFTNLVQEVIYVSDSVNGLKMSMSKVRDNVVIAISDDIVFSKELLSKLNKLSLHHNIVLFGLPLWNDYNDLETTHLVNLNFHYFTTSLVNYHSDETKRWIKRFREIYKTEPSINNYAFDGFDAGWYFLNGLYNFGPDFINCVEYMDANPMHTRYEFIHSPGNGYQNSFWNIGKYESYNMIRVN